MISVKNKIDQSGFPRNRWMTALKVSVALVVVSLLTYFYFGLHNCSLGIVGFSAGGCDNLSPDQANLYVGFGLVGLGITSVLFLVFLVLVLVAAVHSMVWFLKRDR
jgi:hypothetical protein